MSGLMSEMDNDAVVAGSKKDRAILLAGLVTYGIGQSLLFIIFAPLGQKIGMSAGQIGTIISISNLAILFAAPIWGRKSDTMGRRKVFVIGLVGYSLGYAGLAIALEAGNMGLLMAMPLFLSLVGARLLYGGLAGAMQPAAQAYMADTTDERSRPQAMALIGSAGGLGTIIGPIFAGGLAEISPLFPMYAAAAIGLLAAIWAHLRLVEPPRRRDAQKQEGAGRVFAQIFPYLLGWFVVFFVFTAIQIISVFMISNQLGVTDGQEQIRIMRNAFLFMALITVVMQVVVMQKWKMQPRYLLRSAFILFGIVILFLASATTRMELYLVFVAMGFAVSLAMPSLTAAASLTVGASDQGIAAGLLTAAPTFGMLLGPMSMGHLYEYDPVMPIWFCTAMLVLTGIYFWFVKVPLTNK
jgi:DHA1 family multidrug resistance protein-like MFS transporter